MSSVFTRLAGSTAAIFRTGGPKGPSLASAVPLSAIALRVAIPNNLRETTHVDSYSTPGDGGGGTFYWNASDTRPDDGGTIFKSQTIATGRWNRVYSGALNPRWFGAKGDWNGLSGTDDTAAIVAAIAAAGSGGHVQLTFPGNYRITGVVEMTFPITISMQKGAKFVPNAPDGISDQHVYFWKISSSNVAIDGLSCDYSALATHTENTRYLIWAAGANAGSHISNVQIKNCSLLNFMVGAFVPPSGNGGSLNVGHGIFCTWVDELLAESNVITDVSGFGIFLEGCNHPTIKKNTLTDIGWAGIVVNSGGFGGLIDDNRLLSTLGPSGHRFDEGGMLGIPGTPSDGMGGNYRLVVSHNYLTGYVEYGEGIRLASSSQVDIDSNVIDQVYGSSAAGPDACITLDTRGGQNDACHDIRIRSNVLIAPDISLLHNGSSGPGIAGIFAQNVVASGSGRSSGLIVTNNHFISKDATHFFTTAIAVHGQNGGWDDIDIHDNIGSGWCMATANVAGFCTVIAGSSTVTNARIHHNTFTRVPGTANDGNQIGVLVGQNCQRVSVDHNTCDTFNTPIEVSVSGTSDIALEQDAIGGAAYVDYGNRTYQIRRSGGTLVASFNETSDAVFSGLVQATSYLRSGSDLYLGQNSNIYFFNGATFDDGIRQNSSALQFAGFGSGFSWNSHGFAASVMSLDESGNLEPTGNLYAHGYVRSGADLYLGINANVYWFNGSTFDDGMRRNATIMEWAGFGAGFQWYSSAFAAVIASLSETGVMKLSGGLAINGSTTTAKPTITGSRGGNAALASLLTALAAAGFVTDGTS